MLLGPSLLLHAQWKPHSRGFWKHAPLRFSAFLTGFCLPRSFLFLQGSILKHIFPYPNGNLVSYLFLIFLYTNSSWRGLSLPMGSWTPSGWERAASGLRVTMAPWLWDAVPAPSPASQLSQPLLLPHLTTHNPDWIASLWANPFSGRTEAAFFLVSSQPPLSYIQAPTAQPWHFLVQRALMTPLINTFQFPSWHSRPLLFSNKYSPVLFPPGACIDQF